METGYVLGAALGAVGLFALIHAARSEGPDEDYAEFETQHYRAAGFGEPQDSIASQLATWAIGMIALGIVIRSTPELLAGGSNE